MRERTSSDAQLARLLPFATLPALVTGRPGAEVLYAVIAEPVGAVQAALAGWSAGVAPRP
jgi:hypothetical protein